MNSESTPVSTRLQEAMRLHQQGQFSQARTIYEEILERQPDHRDALHLLGMIAGQTNDFERAVALLGRVIDVDPNNAAAYNDRGLALKSLKQCDLALASYNRAIALKGDYALAYCNRGNILRDLGRSDAALASYNQAIAIKPDYAEAYYNRGVMLNDLKEWDAALASYDQALAINGSNADAWSNRGVVLENLRRWQEALASYDQAIALRTNHVEAYSNRGNVLKELKRYEAALASFDRAIAIKDGYVEAHYSRGIMLRELRQYEAAIASFNQVLAFKPDYKGAYGMRLHVKMHICDWDEMDTTVARLTAGIERGEAADNPLSVMAWSGSPSFQKKATRIWVQNESPQNSMLPAIPKRAHHDKIRVGYFSPDFRNHPVSRLTAELFETHDRTRFEVSAFSYGPDTQDEMRKRLEGAFDRFIDVRGHTDREIAQLARSMELDIAVDLSGFTEGCRMNVFALRAAPLQASYIGYLGTSAADYMDYLIADQILVPEEHQVHYSEKIVYLPSYQANDSKRRIADKVFTRDELGLPPTGFVYCCFNASFKITPVMFDSWMRILQRVEGSVLFLFEGSEGVASNLRKEALLRGIDAGRLVFGRALPLPEYLSRFRSADLFLDTLPYNAGTIASDALWAGLPVLTRAGETFAGRVAASLLTAIGLPELIASTQDEYEELAVELAADPIRLARIRQRLAQNRLTAPLFDTVRFARHLEDAYTKMYERYRDDLPPDHIHVHP